MNGAPRPITIAILAMGGEGGGVLADWLVDVAEHGAHLAQATSVPGVAQRTGATVYYLEMFAEAAAKAAGRDPVLSLMPVPGDIDLVVASELMEAGRAIERGLVTPERTTLIASTHRVYAMTEKIAPQDGRVDAGRLTEACRLAARRFIGADMAALAEASGSVISAVLLGAIAGAEVLPFGRAAFEAAVRRGGVGVKQSLAAFAAGYEAARDDGAAPVRSAAAAPTGGPLAAEIERFAAPARDFVRAGVERLIDYQDLAYAREYLARLAPVAEAEQRHGDGSGRLLSETARELALAMAYEDTVRVAELKIRPERFARVREEVRAADGQIVEIAEFLHPRVEEIADTLPAGLGRWLLRPGFARRATERLTRSGKVVKTTSLGGFLLLYCVASLKRFRRGSLRFAAEARSIDEWLATIVRLAADNYALAAEVAEVRTLLKGYGDTRQRGLERFTQLMALVPRLAREASGSATFARLRQAALADEEGTALARALAELQLVSPAAAADIATPAEPVRTAAE
jgi:indolepyruvate ferredoxin oxidoreductase, beta subunit